MCEANQRRASLPTIQMRLSQSNEKQQCSFRGVYGLNASFTGRDIKQILFFNFPMYG
ncbi:hypothetical protein GOODEAATRI_003566, partial [Goodea atripinnis]